MTESTLKALQERSLDSETALKKIEQSIKNKQDVALVHYYGIALNPRIIGGNQKLIGFIDEAIRGEVCHPGNKIITTQRVEFAHHSYNSVTIKNRYRRSSQTYKFTYDEIFDILREDIKRIDVGIEEINDIYKSLIPQELSGQSIGEARVFYLAEASKKRVPTKKTPGIYHRQ